MASFAVFEPRSGRIPVALAIAYTTIASAVWYAGDRVPTLWIPVFVSLLPVAATSARLGITLRATAGALLVVWIVLGALTVGEFYIPAAVAMFIGYSVAKKKAQGLPE